MRSLVVAAWRGIGTRARWRLLWLLNAKFIIGVSGIVLNERNEVLLLRHRFWPEGSWGLPSGYAHRSESLQHAVDREIAEETGLRVEATRLVQLVSGYRLRIEATYLATLRGGQLQVDPREILEARFFALDDLPPGLLTAHRTLLQLARRFGGEPQLLDARDE